MHEQLTLDGSPPVAVPLPFPGPVVDDHVEDIVRLYGFDAVEAALGRIKIATSGPIPQVGQRTDDPHTSVGRRSADLRKFKHTSLTGRLLVRFSYANDGLTDAEATNKVMPRTAGVGQWEGCRRRCSDLRAAGYLDATLDERDNRIVWKITPQGRRAVQSLQDTGWSR